MSITFFSKWLYQFKHPIPNMTDQDRVPAFKRLPFQLAEYFTQNRVQGQPVIESHHDGFNKSGTGFAIQVQFSGFVMSSENKHFLCFTLPFLMLVPLSDSHRKRLHHQPTSYLWSSEREGKSQTAQNVLRDRDFSSPY